MDDLEHVIEKKGKADKQGLSPMCKALFFLDGALLAFVANYMLAAAFEKQVGYIFNRMNATELSAYLILGSVSVLETIGAIKLCKKFYGMGNNDYKKEPVKDSYSLGILKEKKFA